ncbi:MAG: hypothetical protein P4M09_16560 [Devosia sp.]|nr:hypothetical protein [Devosia sp.]
MTPPIHEVADLLEARVQALVDESPDGLFGGQGLGNIEPDHPAQDALERAEQVGELLTVVAGVGRTPDEKMSEAGAEADLLRSCLG